MYTCSKCGADCPNGVRVCGHNDSPIFANMSATAVSVSNMGQTGIIDKVKNLLADIFNGGIR